MTQEVSSPEIAEYLPAVQRLARKYIGREGAELDDLVQEGLLAVWVSLARGNQPKDAFIEGRMKNWVRYLRGHKHSPQRAETIPWQDIEESFSDGISDPD